MNIDICIPSLRGVDPEILNLLWKETEGEVIVSYRKPLVLARKELIAKVKTDLLFFLDDDVLYTKGLLGKLHKAFLDLKSLYVRKLNLKLPALPIGAVQGSLIPKGLSDRWDEYFFKTKQLRSKVLTRRFMTSNTLLRTDLVKTWDPPLNISGAEDYHLSKHVMNQGYNCISIPTNSYHLSSWRKVKTSAVWGGSAYRRMIGHFPASYFFNHLGAIVKHLFLLPFNPRLSYYTIYQNSHVLKGVLRG